IIPPQKEQAAAEDYTQLLKAMDFAALHMDRLKDLSAQKTLPNQKIAREAFFIHDAMADIKKRLAAISTIVYGTSQGIVHAKVTTITKKTVIHDDNATTSGVSSAKTNKSTTESVTTESSSGSKP